MFMAHACIFVFNELHETYEENVPFLNGRPAVCLKRDAKSLYGLSL